MKPCNNLYAHVCAAVIQNGSGKSEMLLRNLQEMIAGLPVTPADRFASSPSVLTDSRAGVFLQGLYSSCVAASKAKPHQDQDGRNVPAHFVQMAAALWDIGRELLANLTEPNFLVFLFIMNLKYQIRSVVEIHYSSSDGTLLFYHDALKLSSEMHLVCRECVAAAVNAYNRTEGTSRPPNGGGHQQQVNTSCLMFSHVAEFAENLHMLYPERSVVERFVIANISQLWPTEQFAKALSILSWVNSVADVSVESFGVAQLVILRQKITDRSNWLVGAVYLVAHTIARAYLTIPSFLDAQNAHQVCMEVATDMTALVNAAHWDLYGSPEKEHLVADMYESVLSAVALEASSGLLVTDAPHKTNHSLQNFVAGITLLTAEATNADAARVPNATAANFAGNVLLGRLFQFHVREKRQRLGLPKSFNKMDPTLHTGRRLYLEVPASLYRFLRFAESPNPINIAVLGVPLAELLWTAVLRHDWDNATQGNVEWITHCFAESFTRDSDELPGSVHNYEAAVRVSAASLALRTVIRSMNQEDWYTLRDIDSKKTHARRLSHAQLFFLLQAYFKCLSEVSKADEDYVNVPAAYAPEFESAFRCPRTEFMHRLRTCTPHPSMSAS
ncbi:uncharacterized protein LOC144129889 [Amblyomma americanum]